MLAVGIPFFWINGAVPAGAPPAKNCTVPVGTPAPGASTLTVAVNGIANEASSAVAVPAFPTATVSTAARGAGVIGVAAVRRENGVLAHRQCARGQVQRSAAVRAHQRHPGRNPVGGESDGSRGQSHAVRSQQQRRHA